MKKTVFNFIIGSLCSISLLLGLISCADGSGGGSGSGLSSSNSVADSGVITLTAPSTAGAVTMVADSDPSTKLYEGTSVQEALAYLMTNSLSASYTISVAAGTYNEMLFYTGAASITIEGTGTAEYGTDVLITYSNSGNTNSMATLASNYGVTSGYTRGATRFDGTCNLVLKNVTIQNSYSRSENNGSSTQAEALVFSSTGNMVAYNSSFLSHQDTLYLGNKDGRMWFYKDYISGDVDFIWGYMDVALFEECSIYCRGDETTKAYIFASRSMADAEANKGIVLLNNDIEIASGVTAYYGRNSGADTQAAILNSTIVGAGTLNSALYASAPTQYVEDVAGDLAIGYKDYNNTMNGTLVSTSSRLTLCGELSERVANREYNGRYAILNRGYDADNKKYETASTIWDISAYETEFEATEDTSADNIYVDPVYAKNIVGGNTVQLTPSSDATGLTYTYASSNTDIATVDANGLVTTVSGANGTATITVTASNGNTDTMSVKVIPEEISATAVSVALADSSVAKYGITTAIVTFSPANATEQGFTLTSSDSSVKFYEEGSGLVSSTTVEAVDGSAEVYVWVSGSATLTATSTAYESATAGTATVSVTDGEATWCDQAGSYRIATDIQSGNAGLWDGLVINSAADGTIITQNGKMSLKSYPKMQTRNVTLYIPVEGASTVTLNLAAAADTSACYYTVGNSTSNDFTANSGKTAYTYTYDGSATGIVLGSTLSDLTFYKTAGDSIDANTKYLKVNVVKSGSDVYLSSIDVTKTGDFTATWEESAGETVSWDWTSAAVTLSESTDFSSTVTQLNGKTGYAKGSSDTVFLYVDASSGKLATRTSDAQFNSGTKIRIPVSAGSVVTANVYATTYELGGTAASSKVSTYTATKAGYVVLKATGNTYLNSITVTNLVATDDFTSDVNEFAVATGSVANDEDTLGLTATSVSSSDTSVATASVSGSTIVITSVATGTATITASDGTNSATIAVTVGDYGAVTVKEITPYTTKTWADYAAEDYSWTVALANSDSLNVSGSTSVWRNMVIVASSGDSFKTHSSSYYKVNAATGIVLYIPMTGDGTITIGGDGNCGHTVYLGPNDTTGTAASSTVTYNYTTSDAVLGSSIGDIEGIEQTGSYAMIKFAGNGNSYCKDISRAY